MAIKSVEVTIKGKSPLLMHKFPLVPIEAPEKKTPEEQAELAAYRTEKGELFVPGMNVQRALVAGAVYSKGKGRASLQKVAAAVMMVSPMQLLLGTKEYVVDSRPVVITATKGRIVRHRPRLDEWAFSFTLDFDDTLVTEAQARKVVDDTCERVGFLDFRPERKGPFGRGMVTSWKVV